MVVMMLYLNLLNQCKLSDIDICHPSPCSDSDICHQVGDYYECLQGLIIKKDVFCFSYTYLKIDLSESKSYIIVVNEGC